MTDKVKDDPSLIVTPPAKRGPVAEVETATAGSTTVVRASVSDDDCGLRFDAVGIRNLRVLIKEEEPNVWVALGLEIDYAAQGRSIAEVKQRFQDGLRSTITEQLKQYRSIKQLLVKASDDVFLEFQAAIEGPVLYSQVSFHVDPIKDELPITYVSETTKAA
jgi:hypothetical protein